MGFMLGTIPQHQFFSVMMHQVGDGYVGVRAGGCVCGRVGLRIRMHGCMSDECNFSQMTSMCELFDWFSVQAFVRRRVGMLTHCICLIVYVFVDVL